MARGPSGPSAIVKALGGQVWEVCHYPEAHGFDAYRCGSGRWGYYGSMFLQHVGGMFHLTPGSDGILVQQAKRVNELCDRKDRSYQDGLGWNEWGDLPLNVKLQDSLSVWALRVRVGILFAIFFAMLTAMGCSVYCFDDCIRVERRRHNRLLVDSLVRERVGK